MNSDIKQEIVEENIENKGEIIKMLAFIETSKPFFKSKKKLLKKYKRKTTKVLRGIDLFKMFSNYV